MSTPSICCVCLTADRQRLTDRAVRCFLWQSYENRQLFIYDTGQVPYVLPDFAREQSRKIILCRADYRIGVTIGALRNEANDLVRGADVIAHCDSDDWSRPERLSVQLKASINAQCVGFHNLLFFDSRQRDEAWEYDYRYGGVERHPIRVLGTSLFYWRDTWLRRPFDEDGVGEDHRWFDHQQILPVQLNGVSSPVPMIIAEFHGGNTCAYGASHEPHFKPIFDRHVRHENPEWRRAPEWDQYCREVMN